MKIALISSFALKSPPESYGGLERVAYEEALGLSELGHDVTLIASKGSKAPSGAKLIETVQSFDSLNPEQKQKYAKADRVFNAWRAQEEEAFGMYGSTLTDFDVVLDLSWSKWSYSSKKDEIVGVCHSVQPFQTPPPREFPLLCGVSKGHARALTARLHKPHRVIWNPVNVEEFEPKEKKEDRILSLNRIMPTKGIHLFLDVVERCKVKADVVGDDSMLVPDQNYVAMIKERCKKSSYAVYWGLVPDDKRVQKLQECKATVCMKDGGYEEIFGLCLHPDDKVLTYNGEIPISQLNSGDRVYSGYGRPASVLATSKRPYSGNMIRIRSKIIPSEINCTPEHPILAYVRSKGAYQVPIWKQAKDLTFDDELCIPSPKVSYRCDPFIKPHRPPPARLLGYYAAEGYVTQKDVRFCFNVNESSYVDDCVEMLSWWRKDIRYTEDVKLNHRVLRVRANGEGFNKFLLANFGTGAWNKRVPDWMIHSQKADRLVDFVIGAWRGDGCVSTRNGKKIAAYSTVSKTLALQMHMILLRLRIRSSVNDITQAPSAKSAGNLIYQIVVSGKYFDRLMQFLGRNEISGSKAQNDYSHLNQSHHIVPIAEIQPYEYEGYVNDIQVAGDESFTVGGLTVHNCAVESLAAGTPVVALNSWGFQDVLSEKSGVICNTVDEVASAVSKIMSGELVFSAAECRKQAELFRRQNVCKGIEQTLTAVKNGSRW